MTLSQLLKSPPRSQFKTNPDHIYLHNNITLNLKTKQRINLDCTKPLRPQLDINEPLVIYTETNDKQYTYIENYLHTTDILEGIRGITGTTKKWRIYNKNKKMVVIINKHIDHNITTIRIFHLLDTTDANAKTPYQIFYKRITPNKTEWKKTYWGQTQDTMWIKKTIESNGVIYERNNINLPLKLTQTGIDKYQ